MGFPENPVDGMVYNGYYWDNIANAWLKTDEVGMVSPFPMKNKPGWLLCNGTAISKSVNTGYAKLVDYLKKEVRDTSIQKVIVTIPSGTASDNFMNLSAPGDYFTIGGINADGTETKFYVWFSVEDNETNPFVDGRTGIKVDIPSMDFNETEIAGILVTAINQGSANTLSAKVIGSDVYIECVNTGVTEECFPGTSVVTVVTTQKGALESEHPYYDSDPNKARVPDIRGRLVTGIDDSGSFIDSDGLRKSGHNRTRWAGEGASVGIKDTALYWQIRYS